MSHPTFDAPSLETLANLLPAYDFEQLIAVGGMGAVYKAKQRSLDRDVAIKILPKEMGSDPEFRQSFETEAKAMARLNHPNLIGVYDSGSINDMLYIVMEYVPGKSLYHSAYGRKIETSQAVQLIKGICAGLGHAHENGIIHRDIKPANILLTPKAEAKIGDFGLARPVEAEGPGLVMGTPGYTAPEVISNPHVADRRSDLFAVGVILYELLTGARQEPGAKPPSTLCGCDPGIDSIWQRATHPNPAFRFPDAQSFQSALSEWNRNQSKSSSPAPAAKSPAAAPAPARKAALLTAAPAPKKILATPEGPDSSSPAPASTPPPEVIFETKTNWSFARNLVIIAALIVIIAGTWKKLEATRIQREKTNREMLAKQAEDRVKREIEAKERAAMLAEQARNNKKPTVEPDQPSTPTTPTPPPEPETPAKSLARLRFDLASGGRAEMPIGTVRHGESDYFLVTDPLPWQDAANFAENHGGHLAIPTSPEDINWIAQIVPPDTSLWIGAGRSGKRDWSLVDGSPWNLPTQPRGTGSHAAVSNLGLVRATNSSDPLPFLIQWRRDGSNPATLAASLQATRESLSEANPVFPPGTQAIGTRHYLVIMRPFSFREAADWAEKSGGHLAVASDSAEASDLDTVTEGIKAEDGIWLGGMKPTDSWVWITGEPWKTAKWADAEADQRQNSALIQQPGKGWAAQDPAVQVSGFVIEWSKDRESASAQPEVDVQPTAGLGGLETRAKELLIAADKKRTEALAANAKTFAWDLDVWIRGLAKGDQVQWQPEVNDLKATVINFRVPEQIPENTGINLSPQMSKIAVHCADKQKQIDSAFLVDADRVRMAYIAKVREAFADAEKRGQRDLAISLRQALVDSGSIEPWIESFGIDPTPENPVPEAVGRNEDDDEDEDEDE